jgi:hypothetical protein
LHSAFRRTFSKVDSGSLGNTGAKKSKIDGLSGSPGTGERPALYGGGRPRWSIGHDRAVGLLGGCCSASIEQSATIEQSASWAAATRPPGRRWTPAGLAASAPSPIPARRLQCCSAAEGPNGLRLAVLLRRVSHAALAWWRSATMEDHAVARERERGSRCLAAVGHDGGPCGSLGTGERITLLGSDRPRWRAKR